VKVEISSEKCLTPGICFIFFIFERLQQVSIRHKTCSLELAEFKASFPGVTRLIQKILFIFLLTLQSAAFAGTDACNGVHFQIPKDRLPVRNQFSTNLCASCATASLLDYLAPKNAPISEIQVSAFNPNITQGSEGKTIDVHCGSNTFCLAASMQNSGCKVRCQTEKDRNLLKMSGLLEQYYVLLAVYPNIPKDKIETLVQQIKNLSEQKIKELPPVPKFDPTAKVDVWKLIQAWKTFIFETHQLNQIDLSATELKLPFQFRMHVIPGKMDDAIAKNFMLEEFKAVGMDVGYPMSVNVCAKKLFGTSAVIPTPAEDDCRPHAMIVSGVEAVGDKCVIELQNSSGENFGNAGRVKFPVEHLWNSRLYLGKDADQSQMEITSLLPAEEIPLNQLIVHALNDGKYQTYLYEGEFYPISRQTKIKLPLLKKGKIIKDQQLYFQGEITQDGKIINGTKPLAESIPAAGGEILSNQVYREGKLVEATFARHIERTVLAPNGLTIKIVTDITGKIEDGKYGKAIYEEKQMVYNPLYLSWTEINPLGRKKEEIILTEDGQSLKANP